MMKLIRVVAIILGVLVLLVVAAVVIVPLVVDPNDYKAEISSLVKDQTGRDLEIPGQIGLSVFPWLGLELGEVQLSNAPGFDEKPFAQVESMDIRVMLLPLLKKHVEMGTVSLQGVVLNLTTNKDGKTNWEDLAGAPAEPAVEAPEEAPEEAPDSGPPVAALAVGGIEIKNARVVWDDQSKGQYYELDQLQLSSGPVQLGEPVELALVFDLASTEPVISAHTDLTGEVSVDESLANYRVNDLNLVVDLREGPQAIRGKVRLLADILANTAAQQYQLDDLTLTVDAKGEGLPGGAAKASLSGRTVADLAAQTLELAGLQLSAYGVQLKGKLQGNKIIDDPQFNGTFKVPAFSPRTLLRDLGQALPETADAKALSQADVSFKLAATANSADIKDLAVTLDDSHLTGTAGVRNFDKPAIRFALKLDGIDADRYLPPKREEEAAAPPPMPAETATAPPPMPAEAATAAATELPVETLRTLDLEGALDIGNLKLSGLTARDIQVKVKGRDGNLTTKQTIGRFYEGKFKSELGLDVRKATPSWTLDEQLTGVQAGPMLSDLLGKKVLSGVAQSNARINGTGIDPDQAKKSARGTASFEFLDGAVYGINVARKVREAEALIKGQSLPPDDEANKTDFTELRGSANIADGVVRNQDLEAKSPLLRITGAGEANLVTEEIDYLVKAIVVGSLKGQGGADLKELKGVTIPIRLVGDLNSPSFKLDAKALLSTAQKAKLEEAKEKAKTKVEEKIQEKIGDKLKDTPLEETLKGLFR